jgi:hypothetical protein
MSPAHSERADDIFSWVGIIMYLPTQDAEQREAITRRFAQYNALCRDKLWPVYGAHQHWAKIEMPESADELTHLRRRLDTRVMLNVLEAHEAHGAVMGAPRVATDVAVARSAGLEWAQDNEDAVRWLLHHALTGEGAEAAVATGRSEAAAAEAEAAAVAGSRVESQQRRHQRRLGWVRAAQIRTAAARQWLEELEADPARFLPQVRGTDTPRIRH